MLKKAIAKGVSDCQFAWFSGATPQLGSDNRVQVNREKIVFGRAIAEDEIDFETGWLIVPAALPEQAPASPQPGQIKNNPVRRHLHPAQRPLHQVPLRSPAQQQTNERLFHSASPPRATKSTRRFLPSRIWLTSQTAARLQFRSKERARKVLTPRGCGTLSRNRWTRRT